MKKLTGGQITVLVVATIPIIAVGVGGAIGTYTNAASVLHRKGTALGVVAGGEGATLAIALVMIVVTMFGQTAPRTLRTALWLLPSAAAVMGLAIAPTTSQMVVFALTPLAMTASAEGLSFLARRVVAHRTDTDIEAQQRNAATLRRIAYHRARAERHPWGWVRRWSELKVWRLMGRIGEGDSQLGSGLIAVQRNRLTEGADAALSSMLTGATAQPASRALEPGEPEPVDFETTVDTALTVTGCEPRPELAPPVLPTPATMPTASDQVSRREPGLSPAEPAAAKASEAPREPSPEPELDEREQQITELANRMRQGERLTKNTAAEILGVSPATAGRRLKDARTRLDDGTGMYL